MKRFPTWCMYLMLVLCLLPASAFAHASLLATSPERDAVIKESPEKITLDFSEPLELETSQLHVTDSSGKKVNLTEFNLTPGNAREMYAKLPPLSKGTYVVSYSVLSEDGHLVSDSFTFSVGLKTSVNTSPSQGMSHSLDPVIPIFRFFVECVTLLFGGLYWFSRIAQKRGHPSFTSLIERWQRYGAIGLGLGSIIMLLSYASELPEGLLSAIFIDGRWYLLRLVPFVGMISVQLILLLLVALPRMSNNWFLIIWGLLIFIPAASGHAWATEPTWAGLIARILHRVALSFWLGALAYITLIMLWKRTEHQSFEWKKFRPFFVTFVAASALLTIVSGVLMALLQTGGVTALTKGMTSWTFLLILKVVLVLIMLSLALRQTVRWQKAGSLNSAYLLSWEFGVGILAILAGILMSQSPYPIQ